MKQSPKTFTIPNPSSRSFFNYKGPLSLGEICKCIPTLKIRCGQKDQVIHHLCSLESASSRDLSFFHNTRYKADLERTQAGAVIVEKNCSVEIPPSVAVLETQTPHRDFSKTLALFYTPQSDDGIHTSAIIHKDAIIEDGCSIGPGVCIARDVHIGKGTRIGAQTFIDYGVSIGKYCVIAPHVTLSHARIGNHVVIKPGARIGQQGFGFFLEGKDLVKQPQIGMVVLEDYVEVGANTTIDRGSLKDTVIKAYTHIDNLCQVAHNVKLDEGVILAAQTGIAGSSRLGAQSMCGGQVGISGHLNIGAGVQILAQSGVMRDVPPGEAVAGSPAIKRQEWHRRHILLSKIQKYSKLILRK